MLAISNVYVFACTVIFIPAMGLFEKKQDVYLGVDIGAHGIKVVELHKTKDRPQLWTYGLIDDPLDIHVPDIYDKTPEDLLGERKEPVKSTAAGSALTSPDNTARITKFANLLKTVLKEARVTTKRAIASLPVSYVFHTVLTLPELSDKEVLEHVYAKVGKVLPRPIEDMQVVHQIIPQTEIEKKKKNMRVLVTAAPKELIVFYTSIFEQAGVELIELETEAFALERSLVGRDTATVMVVDIGAERTNFFIMDQGLPVTHRSIQIGGKWIDTMLETRLGLPRELTSQVKNDISHIDSHRLPPELFQAMVQPIIKEVQYGFDLFLHQTGNEEKRPEKIVLTGGSAVMPAIATALSDAFPMKVFVGDPWARVVYQESLKPLLDELGPRMAVAIGLGLRNIV